MKDQRKNRLKTMRAENNQARLSLLLTRAVSVRLLRIETAISDERTNAARDRASVAEEFERILSGVKNNKVAFC